MRLQPQVPPLAPDASITALRAAACPSASLLAWALLAYSQLLLAMRPHPTYEEALSDALSDLAGKLKK